MKPTSAHAPLRKLAENLWVAERPQSFYALPVGTRTTVVRLTGDGLPLHSPVRLGPCKLGPLLIRDHRTARESLERILAWDFDRVVVAHGDVLERGGHEILRDGYSWLLSPPGSMNRSSADRR